MPMNITLAVNSTSSDWAAPTAIPNFRVLVGVPTCAYNAPAVKVNIKVPVQTADSIWNASKRFRNRTHKMYHESLDEIRGGF